MDEKDWSLFLSVFLFKAGAPILGFFVYYFVDPLWFRLIKPALLRVETHRRSAMDALWDRVYVAYWRRKGFRVTGPRR